jgi:hypothetical protein
MRSCGLVPLCAALLLAESVQSWKSKPIERWDNEDAKQILADSPWVGRVSLQPIPDRSPGERRDGGDWDSGIGPGVGIAGTGLLGRAAMEEAIARAHFKPSPGNVDIRWESALPVRAAESKLGQIPATTLHTGWYAITLYDVPLPDRDWGPGKLKGLAYLKRENKRDFKPAMVEIRRQSDGMADITYLFPRSEEISRRDRSVVFVAQIDRLFVSEFFFPGTMLIAGQLEL